MLQIPFLLLLHFHSVCSLMPFPISHFTFSTSPSTIKGSILPEFFKFYVFIHSSKERETSVVCPTICAFISWFLYVSWPGIETATLAYRKNALTNWTSPPGLPGFLRSYFHERKSNWSSSTFLLQPHHRSLNGQWFDCILVKWPTLANHHSAFGVMLYERCRWSSFPQGLWDVLYVTVSLNFH